VVWTCFVSCILDTKVCAHASQRRSHNENQKIHPHPQLSPVFLVGTTRRRDRYRLPTVVHPSPDCTALSALSLSHTHTYRAP
jgi:hypothetical protein